MSGTGHRGRGCACLSIAAEHARVDQLAEELERADGILHIALNCLNGNAKRDFIHRVIAAGLDGEGVIRANEREKLLGRVSIARAGRRAGVLDYPQAQVIEAAALANAQRKPVLAQDLAALAIALPALVDAASEVASSNGDDTAALERLSTQLRRFGPSHRAHLINAPNIAETQQ